MTLLYPSGVLALFPTFSGVCAIDLDQFSVFSPGYYPARLASS
ncbi:hypothetical protein ACJJID_14635 [Microbulbifer sp. CnH-101-G]